MESFGLEAHQGFPYPPEPHVYSPEQSQTYRQHRKTTMVPFQIAPHDAAYSVEQTHVMHTSPQVSHGTLVYSRPQGSLSTQSVYQENQQRYLQEYQQRSFTHTVPTAGSAHDYLKLQQIPAFGIDNIVNVPVEMIAYDRILPMHSQAHTYSVDVPPTHSTFDDPDLPVQSRHNDHLSNRSRCSTHCWIGYDSNVVTVEEYDPPSVVGQPGMPEPAPKPKGPKLKFTSEEDCLLIELKETKDLTWKQVADFFPGRTPGTLQVRYCTKLKAKPMVWTRDMVRRYPAPKTEGDSILIPFLL
jgi:hypothetical protein